MARKTFGKQGMGDESTLLPKGKPGDEYSDTNAESWKINDGTAAPKVEKIPTWDSANPSHIPKSKGRA